MKKLLLLAALAVGMMFNVNAQESGFGVRASFNLSNVSDKYTGDLDGASRSDYEIDFKSRIGFNVGVIYDWGLSESFYIQPGLYFTTRGAKVEDRDGETDLEQKWNLSYLQLPILASYRIKLTDNAKLHINAGPYIAYGVTGKVKVKASYRGRSEEAKYDAFGVSDEDSDEPKGGLKRFDAGLSFGAGVSINKCYVGLTYDLGLTNAAHKDEYGKDYKLRNRNLSIGVGYNF